jgi:hypothetical protein
VSKETHGVSKETHGVSKETHGVSKETGLADVLENQCPNTHTHTHTHIHFQKFWKVFALAYIFYKNRLEH